MTMVTTRAVSRRDLRAVLGRVATHGYLVLLVLFVALPLAWVLLLSLKTLPDAYTNQIIPRFGLTLEHYWQTWGAIGSLRRNFLNSAMVAVGSIALTVAAAGLLAYAVVHLRFRAKAVVIVTAFAALLIPVRVSGIIGVWAVQRQLDLLDSVLGLIPPYSTFGLAVGFFIMEHLRVDTQGTDGSGGSGRRFGPLEVLACGGPAGPQRADRRRVDPVHPVVGRLPAGGDPHDFSGVPHPAGASRHRHGRDGRLELAFDLSGVRDGFPPGAERVHLRVSTVHARSAGGRIAGIGRG